MAQSRYSSPDNDFGGNFKLFQENLNKQYRFRLGLDSAYSKKLEQLKTDEYKKEEKRLKEQYKKDLEAAKDNEELKEELTKAYDENRRKLEKKHQAERKQWEIESQQFAIQCADTLYEKMNIRQRAHYQMKQAEEQKAAKKALENRAIELDVELRNLEAVYKEAKAKKEDTAAIEAKITDVINQQTSNKYQLADVTSKITKSEEEASEWKQKFFNAQLSILDAKDKEYVYEAAVSEEQQKQKKIQEELADLEAQGQGKSKEAEEYRKLLKQSIETQEDLEDAMREASVQAAQQYGQKEISKAAKDMVAGLKKSNAQRSLERDAKKMIREDPSLKAEYDAAKKEEFGLNLQDNLEESFKAGFGGLTKALADGLNQVDSTINSFYEYQGHIEARLQGSDESYKKSLARVSGNIGLSGLVSQKEVVANIKTLVDAGVAYNVDLRAFLGTISENIANTFDAFDSNLARIIRLQQADTTAARLGMEASLTKLFNEFFSDTSYLSDAFDTVSKSIIDASAQLTRDQSTAFEYIVQKWLGALYSVGLSENAVSTIAEGINYLGTGNVNALNGNDALQSLLAMSASRAGISYADILTGGLDADTTNDLLKSMVEYLASIANNTDNNQVTKSAYANLFGMNITDLRSISNLSKKDISNIYANSLDYGDAMKELNSQMNSMITRIHISQILDTAFENIWTSSATGIGNNPALYGLWKTLNIVEDLTGGIAIPAIEVYGFMVDLHTTITQLAKGGVAGLGLMSSLLSGLFSGGMMGLGMNNLNAWGFDEYTSRGGSAKGISKGTASGLSESSELSMVGSSSGDDIKSTSMKDGTDEAQEDAGVTSEEMEKKKDVYEQIRDAVWSEKTTVLAELIEIRDFLENEAVNTRIQGIEDYLNKTFKVIPMNSAGTGLGAGTGSGGTDGTGGDTGDTGTEITAKVDFTELTTKSDEILAQFGVLQSALLDATYKAEITNLSDLSKSSGGSTNGVGNNATTVTGNKVDKDTSQDIGTDNPLNTIIELLSLERIFKTDLVSIGSESEHINTITALTTSLGSNANFINQFNQANANTTAGNSTTTDNIQNLGDQNTLSSTILGGGVNGNATAVMINGMSEELKTYISDTVKAMVLAALTERSSQEVQDGDDFFNKLQRMLALANLNVTVTNDFFEDLLRKNAFSN